MPWCIDWLWHWAALCIAQARNPSKALIGHHFDATSAQPTIPLMLLPNECTVRPTGAQTPAYHICVTEAVVTMSVHSTHSK